MDRPNWINGNFETTVSRTKVHGLCIMELVSIHTVWTILQFGCPGQCLIWNATTLLLKPERRGFGSVEQSIELGTDSDFTKWLISKVVVIFKRIEVHLVLLKILYNVYAKLKRYCLLLIIGLKLQRYIITLKSALITQSFDESNAFTWILSAQFELNPILWIPFSFCWTFLYPIKNGA